MFEEEHSTSADANIKFWYLMQVLMDDINTGYERLADLQVYSNCHWHLSLFQAYDLHG